MIEGTTTLFCTGKYIDQLVFTEDGPRFKERLVILDTYSVPQSSCHTDLIQRTTAMTIEFQRIGGVLGAQVNGFDLTADHPVVIWEELRSAIMDKCLVLFRGESLSATQLVDVANALGPVMQHVSAKSSQFILPEAPNVHLISSQLNGARYAGQAWHSDYAYIENPAQLSCFYMRKTPQVGGDTAFANMYAAYDALSDRMKTMLDGLDVINNNAQRHRLQYVARGRPSFENRPRGSCAGETSVSHDTSRDRA